MNVHRIQHLVQLQVSEKAFAYDEDLDQDTLLMVQDDIKQMQEEEDLIVLEKQQFVEQRLNQIKFAIILFSLEPIYNLIYIILKSTIKSTSFYCISDNQYETNGDLNLEILILIQSLLYLIPSVSVPYIFYIYPLKKGGNVKKYKYNPEKDFDLKQSFKQSMRSNQQSMMGKLNWSFTANDYQKFANASVYSKQYNQSILSMKKNRQQYQDSIISN
ncbi:hypothetical protein PPERSA_10411 [Pseudocohnilembus persalinus]|uniref:Transmembrane protein n=1 Tax=Pseudocohnilembus persalinus TaxID=266149 RepID=A0A0V0QVZ1_PSEPJ|nr:hypothetical protein PPERSA_10411 [Pseudocohnilembus persalinus]|eukprot:KRX06553.1 hypothetical protein PPERSA_10411 [Pseudocohnilembus persalinus]